MERARCVLGSERRLASSDAGSTGERVTRGAAETGRSPMGRGVIKDMGIMHPLIFMMLFSCVCLNTYFLLLKERQRNKIKEKNMEYISAHMQENTTL